MAKEGESKVLIVGAGPTGLTLALCLQSYGVQCDICDIESGPTTDSKALAINSLSLYQLEIFSKKNIVGFNAQRIDRLNVLWNGNKRLSPIDFRWLDHDKNFLLTQPQNVTEQELINEFINNGGAINWQTKVTKIKQKDKLIQVELNSIEQNNLKTKKYYKYVIGCDGKRSIVRNSIDVRLESDDYEGMYLALGDFKLNCNLNNNQVYYFVYEDTFFVFVPISNSLWRVVVKYDNNIEFENQKDYGIKEIVNKYFKKNIFLSDSFWLSKSPLYSSIASHLSNSKGVFIAGDAAHLYSPLGGTGMNTGIQDALNLGWKIAFVMLDYVENDYLLNTYEMERLPIIKENANHTKNITNLISQRQNELGGIDVFTPKISNRHLIKKSALVASGMGLKYSQNRFGKINAGLRPILYRSKGFSIKGSPFILLAYGSCNSDLLDKLAKVNDDFLTLQCVIIQLKHELASSDDIFRCSSLQFVSVSKDEYRRISPEKGNLQIVRPDGVICYEGDSKFMSEVYRCIDSFSLKKVNKVNSTHKRTISN